MKPAAPQAAVLATLMALVILLIAVGTVAVTMASTSNGATHVEAAF
jgi:hypothetical protein